MTDIPALIDRALAELRAGRPVLVADARERENEVDAIAAASAVSQRWLAWMVRHTSGYLCAPLTPERADALALPEMVAANEDPKRTCYTVSCDAASGVTTGISAADRTRTLRVLADPAATPSDLIRPGHVLPLRARPGGVLARAGHTEATVDLLRLAGLPEVGVIGELVRDDGEMMRYEEACDFAERHDLVLVTIAELAQVVRAGEGPTGPDQRAPRVQAVATAKLPTRHGDFTIHAFRDTLTGAEHVALTPVAPTEPAEIPLARLHSECLTGETFGSLRCDCGPQLDAALERVATAGGAVVYLRGHEGRGIGLAEKVRAYDLQDAGMDTAEANLALGWAVDLREYGAGAAILAALGLKRIRLLTNNPDKTRLGEDVIEVVETVPLEVGFDPHNLGYLRTKAELGHTFTHLPLSL